MRKSKREKRSKEEIRRICYSLLEGKIGYGATEVTIEEFREFYSIINENSSVPPVLSIVNLEDIVVAQFSNISPQHFDIVCDKPLAEDDFNYAHIKWYGRKEKAKNFLSFLWGEILINWKFLTPILLLSFILLFVVNNIEFYQLIASFLIQSATVFLSLFVIFTVSQSQKLYKDLPLFKSGILQNYYDDDQNVTKLGILTIVLVFFSSGITELLDTYKAYISLPILITIGKIVNAGLFAITITMLFDTFQAVASYYLQRSRDVIERDIVAQILKTDYLEENNDENMNN